MAHYLVRFDDLCPTMNHARWVQCEALMRRFSIRPILAVVPENRDPELVVDAEDPQFWSRIRTLQDEGWTIALHGFRHECRAAGKSLVPLDRLSEFAGVSAEKQLAMLEEGLRMLRGYELNPTVWAAPRHGFDENTLAGLKRVGIYSVSDGMWRLPFREDGVLWIPQQLWGGREMRDGVWTICVHANRITEPEFRALESFIKRHAAEFLSVDEVEKRWGKRRKRISDDLASALRLGKRRAGRLARRAGLVARRLT